MDIFPIIISVVAFIFSVTSFIIAHRSQERASIENKRLQEAIFWLNSNNSFESRLFDNEELFKFYGIDLKKAQEEGISSKMIAYLVLMINTGKSQAQQFNITLDELMANSDYIYRIFSEEITHKVWTYSRLCHREEIRKAVESYLEKRHDIKYEKL